MGSRSILAAKVLDWFWKTGVLGSVRQDSSAARACARGKERVSVAAGVGQFVCKVVISNASVAWDLDPSD